jgi:recombination protein RecT
MTTNLAALKSQQGAVTDMSKMKPKEQIAHLLTTKRAEIEKMLPKHLNAERLLKVAQIAATTTPALLKCDVPSLIGAIGQCAQMGLEPNTVLGHAYLVPFKVKRKRDLGNGRSADEWVDSVQVVVGYKGLIDLARRSGQIISLTAHEVCKDDHFELVYGLDEKLNHKPRMDGPRGEIIGFYAIAKFKDGGHAFEFMSRYQVEQIMEGTQSKGKYGPWKDHFPEMGRKTVIRRLAKYLPLSIEFQTAVALDDAASSDRDQKLDNNVLDGDFSFVNDADASADGAMLGAPEGPDDAAFEAQVREVEQAAGATAAAPATTQQATQHMDERSPADKLKHRLSTLTDPDMLDIEADLINDVTDDPGVRADLRNTYNARRAALTEAQQSTQQQAPAARPARQRGGMQVE